MTIGIQDRIRRTLKSSWQELDGETVVLSLREEKLIGFNAAAGRIWQLADGTRTIADIAGVLAAEFDAPAERIQQDVLAFALRLIERNLLELSAS